MSSFIESHGFIGDVPVVYLDTNKYCYRCGLNFEIPEGSKVLFKGTNLDQKKEFLRVLRQDYPGQNYLQLI